MSSTAPKRVLVKRARGAMRGPSGFAVVTPEGLEQIEKDAANALSNSTIASRLGVNRHTLLDLRKRQPEVEEALQRGRGKLEDAITHQLLKQGIGTDKKPGNVIALIFLAKARLGWRDQGPLDGAQVVQINNTALAMTTGEIRSKLADLLAQRELLLGHSDGDEDDSGETDS